MPSALLLEISSSSIRLARSALQIANWGADQYQAVLCLSGEINVDADSGTAALTPGDISVVDTLRMLHADFRAPAAGHCRAIVLSLARSKILPMLLSPDAANCRILCGSKPASRLLATKIMDMLRWADRMHNVQCEIAVEECATLLGQCLNCIGNRPDNANARAIKRYIEQHLDSAVLSADHISERFRCSRATIYRLFGAHGGVARYIQERRLLNAFSLLVAKEAAACRILDIALNCQFSGEASFSRAFQRRFGITPGALRKHCRMEPDRWTRNGWLSTADRSISES